MDLCLRGSTAVVVVIDGSTGIGGAAGRVRISGVPAVDASAGTR